MEWIIKELEDLIAQKKYSIRHEITISGINHKELIEQLNGETFIIEIEQQIKDLEKAVLILKKDLNFHY